MTDTNKAASPEGEGEPIRHHFTEPTVAINGEMLGVGWLLITEAEYASLRTPPTTERAEVREKVVDPKAWPNMLLAVGSIFAAAMLRTWVFAAFALAAAIATIAALTSLVLRL